MHVAWGCCFLIVTECDVRLFVYLFIVGWEIVRIGIMKEMSRLDIRIERKIHECIEISVILCFGSKKLPKTKYTIKEEISDSRGKVS